ncbi:PREDICTED: HLA class II histocompatibility antigen, DM beta chain-like [Nanorana parkeri]|uniref:HLA class II histocompatibility antigen, DM beta chain-like n=1 Tax=Nanorana parkeri TaxID=125878 RepID=UPI000854C129|nr:PREDICTED: HLA class II histocompatibility antigen, DM beta chain-like [Nanorana parkeri]
MGTIGADSKRGELRAKPSVEVFLPVQLHPDSLPVLVCQVWGFYPQNISVAWFKNDKLVKNYTEAVRTGDWTYRILATLDLRNSLPENNYTCLVNHPSLDTPIVKTWKHGLTNIQIIKISVASVVFALGLVCLITGIAFWKNAKRSGYSPIPGYNAVKFSAEMFLFSLRKNFAQTTPSLGCDNSFFLHLRRCESCQKNSAKTHSIVHPLSGDNLYSVSEVKAPTICDVKNTLRLS